MLEPYRKNTIGTIDVEKFEYAMNNPWETNNQINENTRKQTTRQEKLQSIGINDCHEQMITKFVKRMYFCRHCDEQDLSI